jgi:hypothetical protein
MAHVHIYDRMTDLKNFTISQMLHFLHETEMQHEINLNSHLETIYDVIGKTLRTHKQYIVYKTSGEELQHKKIAKI